jgi:hypothetical protein
MAVDSVILVTGMPLVSAPPVRDTTDFLAGRERGVERGERPLRLELPPRTLPPGRGRWAPVERVLGYPEEAGILLGGNGADRARACHEDVHIPRGPPDANNFHQESWSVDRVRQTQSTDNLPR